ncbi:MAG: TrkH family potassium uptake protein [Lachnospiraceae bacterium]|nr:TrkH family potassium uptake protein [Lachnospiraceae bacterium]
MNHSIVRFILLKVLAIEGACMMLPVIISLIYHESQGIVYLGVAVAAVIVGLLGSKKVPEKTSFYSKEGLIIVGLSWILLTIVGALPFFITREIPSYIDCIFETASGFTTTGSTILTDVEALSHTSLFWRSFTHWIGGMGVLVFLLAILPMVGGSSINIMKAESPGPSVGKLVPKIKQTAGILYKIYLGMTIAEIILLLIFGMPAFDAVTLTFGTAGTGGFGVLNAGIAPYPLACQITITVFMFLFGINFSLYYLILIGKIKDFFRSEELRVYFLVVVCATALITWNISPMFDNLGTALHQASFHVSSIITTTGYSIGNFDLWPGLSKTILVLLMFIGACAGSTGGGLKVSRIILGFKILKNEVRKMLYPNRVKIIKMDGHAVPEETVSGVKGYIVVFFIIFGVSLFIISFDNYDFTTSFTSVATTINNIGPGLNMVGPVENFTHYSILSKLVFTMDMLIGRLEIYPMLAIFAPMAWRKNKFAN